VLLNSCLQHWVSDNEDSDGFEWESDEEEAAAAFDAAAASSSALASRNDDAPGPSTRVMQLPNPHIDGNA
jgi:hypothetical protein